MIRVSKFYKDSKEGRFVSYIHDDTRTLYDTFRRGANESSTYLLFLCEGLWRHLLREELTTLTDVEGNSSLFIIISMLFIIDLNCNPRESEVTQ